MISFVCSVGNVPLAAVLWNGGISFGGVVSFLFADLIVLPILDIYRKYYGLKVSAFLFITFYVAMAGASLIVEFLFAAFTLSRNKEMCALCTRQFRGITPRGSTLFSWSLLASSIGMAVSPNGRPENALDDVPFRP